MNHSFDVSVACDVGVDAAILLENIFFWCNKNEANGCNYHDGLYWTYNSASAFSKLFPYMSPKKIYTALGKLEINEYIKSGSYNQNAYDRTKWYAITQKGKCIYTKSKMDIQKKENGFDLKDEPIPDINTIDKPDINTNIKQKTKEKPEKQKYGEYKHVLLSDDEYNKLVSEWGLNETERMIKELDEGIEQHGYKYTNFNLTIRKWKKNNDSKAKSFVGKTAMHGDISQQDEAHNLAKELF